VKEVLLSLEQPLDLMDVTATVAAAAEEVHMEMAVGVVLTALTMAKETVVVLVAAALSLFATRQISQLL
jgi:hypothetical protein